MRIHQLGSKNLEVPNIFASYRIRDYPRAGLRFHPWKITNTHGLLLNAYDLLGYKPTKNFTDEIRKCPGKLHEYNEFDGPIMLDSGAFNFLQHQEISITPIEVLHIGLELNADLSVVLDHPFPPKSTPEEIQFRWANTRKNTQIMVEALSKYTGEIPDGFQLIPVLHGHDKKTLRRALDDIVKIWGREPSFVGIGSLAPLAQNGNKHTVVDVLSTARHLLPQAHIHCFSLGSALLMLFAFYCGADTVDSQTWIMSAAFKQVQLPGSYLTRLSLRETERNPVKYQRIRTRFAQRLLQLIQEEDFVVKNWDNGDPWHINSEIEALEYLDYLEDRDGVNHIHRRACHNLYAFNFEAKRVREERAKGNLEQFIQGRMRSTFYKRAFEYAVEKRTLLER
jgi:queuine/archaeosine tRNA-ribosyltransferase